MHDHSFGKVLQNVWDWRAAGNFMFGGTGSGLLFLVAVFSYPQIPPTLVGFTALFLVAAGLTLVWLEIGRPWRFINVYFNPWTSWMTREAFVAAVVFALALIGILFELPLILVPAGFAGLFFLYCQARILKASKGVPAWRDPAIVPLIQITGVTEGAGLLALLSAFSGTSDGVLLGVFFLLLAGRLFSWQRYRNQLKINNAPAAAQQALAKISLVTLAGGNLLPMLLAGVALAAADFAVVLGAVGGALAVLSGWLIKFTIVTRAAHYQGFVLKKPKRTQVSPA